MATQDIEKVRYSSGPSMIKEYPEASGSLSFKKGEFVYMESDGQIVACAANATKILGIAIADASGTENTMIGVQIAQDGTEFEGNIYHSTEASAITELTNRDQAFALIVADNISRVDIEDTDNDAFLISEILVGGNKTLGDIYGRVKFVVIPAAQQFGAQHT